MRCRRWRPRIRACGPAKKVVAPHRPRRGDGAEGGADRRRGAGRAGRVRQVQRRPRRPDHRHQHGLPGQEGLQQLVRFGPAAARRPGPAHPGSVVRAVDVPGHAEVPHRLGPPEQERPDDRAHGRAGRHRDADPARPHPRRRLQGRCRIRHHRRGEGGRVDSGGGEWRHHDPGKGEIRARPHGRRRRHDRARGPGPSRGSAARSTITCAPASTCRRRWSTKCAN
jgi:hypothetical protein